jgi:hypothetical protein
MPDELTVAHVVPPREGAADDIFRLEAEIALKRERVAASLRELRRRVDGATNWRRWIEAHPFVWIAAGLSLGFMVGIRRGRGGSVT